MQFALRVTRLRHGNSSANSQCRRLIRSSRWCESAESISRIVLYSALADGVLTCLSLSRFIRREHEARYSLRQGPAVFGAVNARGQPLRLERSGFRSPEPARFETGNNRVVADIGGAYAQYHLLTADASAILVVNLDFAPEVFAWDVETGERHDLGEYRECERIPDKVALSADGTALVIGCDTGLDIWRVSEA